MTAKKTLPSRAGVGSVAPAPIPARRRVSHRTMGPLPEPSSSVLRELSIAVQALQAADRLTEPDQFLKHLNELRTEKGLTFDRLGRMCQQRPTLKMSRSGIYTMLNSKQWPTYQQMAAFLYLCDVSPHEYSIWLTEHARGRGVVDPDFEPETVLRKQPEPARSPHQRDLRRPQQPTPPPRHRTTNRWYYRTVTHFAFSVFGTAVVAVTVGVITLHVLELLAQLIAMTCIGAAAGVFTWAYVRLHPDTEHFSKYSFGEPEIFEDDTLTAPSVLGER